MLKSMAIDSVCGVLFASCELPFVAGLDAWVPILKHDASSNFSGAKYYCYFTSLTGGNGESGSKLTGAKYFLVFRLLFCFGFHYLYT